MKAKKENIKFVMNGDFNMSFLESWDAAVITEFLQKSTYRKENNLPIVSAKFQARALLNMTERMNLNQMVKEGTRLNNILDLVLTDDIDIIGDINNIKHEKLSDHDTLVIDLNISHNKDKDELKKNYCLTKNSSLQY